MFKQKLGNLNWSSIEESNDTSFAYTTFLTTYSKIYNECFPEKTLKQKSGISKPWISKGLMKSIKRKNKLYKKYLQNRNLLTETKYKIFKNRLTHSIRIAKRLYFDKSLMENKSNLKETWKILNSVINKKRGKSKMNSVFNVGGKEISHPSEVANNFCNYFSNLGPSLAKKIPASSTPASSLIPF